MTDPTALRNIRLRDYHPVVSVRRPLTTVERSRVPAIDVHNHLGRWLTGDGGWMTPDLAALRDLMDSVNVACIVNLDGRWGEVLAENLKRYDETDPDRFVTFCHLDWSAFTESDAPTRTLIASLRASHAAGARGLKVWKDLGLSVSDRRGNRVLPDDPRLVDVFAEAGALGLPVLIHTADPIAFFAPLDERNERLEELVANPHWWFGGPEHPSFDRLMVALESVVARTPGTTFIAAHAGAAEDLGWVARMLATYHNFHIDIGGRLAELGRRPQATRALITAYPDRVLFGSDGFPPTRTAYQTYWRFLETADECFSYEPDSAVPSQGRWQISAIALPPEVLDRVYAGNARRLLGR